jgi:hypothetical protein
MKGASSLATLVALATVTGDCVLAADTPEPNLSRPSDLLNAGIQYQPFYEIGNSGLASEPFRAVYSFSAVTFSVAVSTAEVRHLKPQLFGVSQNRPSALPSGWAERLSGVLPRALEGAATRAGLATVSAGEIPACPADGKGTVGRLTVDIQEIVTLPRPTTDPNTKLIAEMTSVTFQTRLRLTDNCDREIKSVRYAAYVGATHGVPVTEFLESWLRADKPGDGPNGAGYTPLTPQVTGGGLATNPRLLAEAIIAGGLLAWMPTWSVEDAKTRSTPYTLRAVSAVGKLTLISALRQNVPTLDPDFTLRWESLEDLLAVLGPADLRSRISDIRYELAVYREHALTERIQVVHLANLTTNEWDGSKVLESCEAFAWSVRSHFLLDGFPRVTAWSALHNGQGYFVWPELVWPNAVVHKFRTPPPAGFKECR